METIRECLACGYQTNDKRVKLCTQCRNGQEIESREETKEDIIDRIINR